MIAVYRWFRRKGGRILKTVGTSLGVLLGCWVLAIALRLHSAASAPVGAFFVLGGSIQREIYVATLVKQSPQTPVLISHGSQDPCIWLIFRRDNAPMERVWLEHCANSTFENFFFGVPILQQWGVRKVQLITSQTHLPRAKWLAWIHFGARGIWVDTAIAPEQGIPGNRESWLKTSLDVTRSLLWAVVSQFFQPQCNDTNRLQEVDLKAWQNVGFKCEYQANLEEFYSD